MKPLFSFTAASFSSPAWLASLRLAWMDRWPPFWQARAPRERMILIVGGMALGASLFYLLVAAPLQNKLARLEKNLPVLRKQSAEMQTLVVEARELGSAPAEAALHGSALQQALQASLEGKGMKVVQLVVQPVGAGQAGDVVLIRLSQVPFGQWADWLELVRNQHKLKVLEASIIYAGPNALVNIQAQLQGPK